MSKAGFDAEFDVVVAGGGSAGCVLSARLTENPKVSLCAIEAGGRDRNHWTHIPMGFGKLVPVACTQHYMRPIFLLELGRAFVMVAMAMRDENIFYVGGVESHFL